MNITVNNNANSVSSQLIPGSQGLETADGSVLNGNFLNIISMLSESSEINLTTKDSPEFLLDVSNIDKNFSTVQLLQKFLDEHGVNTKEKIEPDFASKFFKLFKSADRPLEKIESAINNEINIQDLPTEKILISSALEQIKKNYLQGNLSETASDKSTNMSTGIAKSVFSQISKDVSTEVSENVSTEVIDKPNLFSKTEFNLGDKENINQAMLPQAVIDTTVFESSKPKAIVVEIGHVIDEVSQEFEKFQISKLFTKPAEQLGKTSDNQVTKKSDKISSFIINLMPKAVSVKGETDSSSVIYKEVLIPDEVIDQDKSIFLEIDKVEDHTVITTIMSDHLNEPASLPRKIILQFSETKPVGSELSVNLSVISEESLLDTEVSIDTNYAMLLTKANEDRGNLNFDSNVKIKIFNSDYTQSGNDKADWQTFEMETFTKDFSDELSKRLKTYISGEFNNKNMLNSLRESLILEDNNQMLADSIKVQLVDLLQSIKFRPKAKLMLSTADVLGYREAIKISEKQVFDYQFISDFDDVIIRNELKPTELELGVRKERVSINQVEDNFSKLNLHAANKHSNQITTTDNRILTSTTTNTGVNPIINNLNLYESQFTSRLGMLLADQLSQGNKNFELQLEPESFGKVRINVSLENSSIEVKMIAENSAAVLALRGGELMLQNIAEQHGLKLSNYSVDMQNNQDGQSSDQKRDLQKNGELQKNTIEEVEHDLSSNSYDGNYKLNLLA